MYLLPLIRHPGNLQAGVQKYLKNKEKIKAWMPDKRFQA